MTSCAIESTNVTELTYVDYDNVHNDYSDRRGFLLWRAGEVLYNGPMLTIQLDRFYDEDYRTRTENVKSTGLYTYTSSNGFRYYDIVSCILKSYVTEYPSQYELEGVTFTSFRLYENGLVEPNTDS